MPTARSTRSRSFRTERRGFPAFLQSPLTDSSREPLLTMRSEAVAVGCHRLRIGLFQPVSAPPHLRPVATGCARLAP
jgi:hypothetical protein